MADENENVGLDPDFKGPDTEGYERVDTSQLPPNIARVVEARLGRFYRQTKEGQKQVKELKALVETQARDMKALHDRFMERETAEVKTGIKDAFEKGDADTLDRLTGKLVDIKSKPAAEKPPEKIPEKETKPDDPPDLSDFMTAEDEALFIAWADERGEDGKVRPWLDQGHPRHKRAMGVIQAALVDDELRNQGAKAVMAEVDRMMGVTKPEAAPRRTAAVLTGGTPPTRTAGPKLSNEQKRAADLMQVSHDAYAKSFAATPKNSEGRSIYVREFDGDSRK